MTICAKFLICLIPIVVSELNSTQIVPIEGVGFGFEAVAGGVYFSSIVVVGRAEKVIFLRLQNKKNEGMLGEALWFEDDEKGGG